MSRKNPEEALEIDAQRFRAFYGHFEDGRSAAEAGGDKAGAKYLRIDQYLRDNLGKHPSNGYWLGSRSTLEEWKNGTSAPQPRPRKVLEKIYQKWQFDISVNQEFSNRIIVDTPVSDLLEVDGVALEDDGPDSRMLKLGQLQLRTKVRPVKYKDGRLPLAQARLGFSEVTLAVELPNKLKPDNDDTFAYKINLRFLSSGQQHQSGRAEGMSVRVDGDSLAWRLFVDSSTPMIDGQLMRAQLMGVHDQSLDQILIRVEAAMADFNPVIFLDTSTGDWKRDAEDKEKVKRQLQAQILRNRLKGDGERYVLAHGWVASK